MSSLTPKWQVK